MYKSVNVMDFGAKANGRTDDAHAIQKALDSGADEVIIPRGRYKIGHTLYIGSNTRITAHPYAHIRLANNACTKRGDFLLANKNHNDNEHRNENITVKGGIWDGNNATNSKPKCLFSETANSGAIFSFKNVNKLTLSTLTLSEAGGYHARFCRINGFLFENIHFCSLHPVNNNDGIHLNGFCENGIIRNLYANTPGSPSDDMVALNADDIMTRPEALDMECGYIRNIVIDGLHASKCQSFVRILSINSDITNISISNVTGGFWGMAVNMDAARYCMTPIIDPDSPEFREGVGRVENVHLSHFRVHSFNDSKNASYISLESNMYNFTVDDFVREEELEASHNVKTLRLLNISPSHVTLKGATNEACAKKFAKGKEETLVETENELGKTVYSSDFDTDMYDVRLYENGSFERLEINRL